MEKKVKQKEKTDRKGAQIKVTFNKEHKLPLHEPMKMDYPTYRPSILLWSLKRKTLEDYSLQTCSWFLFSKAQNPVKYRNKSLNCP